MEGGLPDRIVTDCYVKRRKSGSKKDERPMSPMRLGQILLISQKDHVSSRACSSIVKPRADEKKTMQEQRIVQS